jgi:transposase
MKTKEQYVTIKQLYHQGYNITQISRMLRINRKTVRKYLSSEVYPGYRNQNRRSQLEQHRQYLETRLNQYPLLSSIRLYQELKDRGYKGGYRMLCKFVRKIRPP